MLFGRLWDRFFSPLLLFVCFFPPHVFTLVISLKYVILPPSPALSPPTPSPRPTSPRIELPHCIPYPLSLIFSSLPPYSSNNIVILSLESNNIVILSLESSAIWQAMGSLRFHFPAMLTTVAGWTGTHSSR